MAKSKYIKSLGPKEVYALVQIAMDPSGKDAQFIFEMLTEEKAKMEHIDKVFNKIVTEAVSDLDNGLMEIKRASGKAKLKKAEAAEKQAASV